MSTATRALATQDVNERALRIGSALMAFAGIAFIGYAILFIVVNFASDLLEIGIGADEVKVTKDQIEQFSPSLYDYVSHANVAIAGFIASTGFATAALSWFGVRRGLGWAWVAAVATPVLGLAIALPLHYPYGFATLGHLGLIYLATAIFVVGALVSLKPIRDRR
jgi:hypothetical protein